MGILSQNIVAVGATVFSFRIGTMLTFDMDRCIDFSLVSVFAYLYSLV